MPRTHHSSIKAWVYERDPFCSTICARKWHGVPLVTVPGGDPTEKRGRYERVAA